VDAKSILKLLKTTKLKKNHFPKDFILPVVKDKFLCFDPFILLQSLQVKLKFILVVTNCQWTTTEKRMNYFPEKK